MPEEAKPEENPRLIYLPSSGALPGIPGTHSPGSYWLDALDRTLTPVLPEIPTDTQEKPVADSSPDSEVSEAPTKKTAKKKEVE